MKSFLFKIQLLKTFFAFFACLFILNSCGYLIYYWNVQSEKAYDEEQQRKYEQKEKKERIESARIKKLEASLKYDFNLIEPKNKVHLALNPKSKQMYKDKKVFKTVEDFDNCEYNIIELAKYMSVNEFETFFKKLSTYTLISEINDLSDNKSTYQKHINKKQKEFKLSYRPWAEVEVLYQAAFEKKLGKKLGYKELFIQMIYQLSFLNALKGSNLKLAAYLLKKGAVVNIKSYYQSDDLSPLSSALMSLEPHKTLLFLKAHGLKKVPLFDSKNNSPLYILSIYSPNNEIDKILSYFLNQSSPKTERKLYNIYNLAKNNNINVLFALFNKKGDKLFKRVNKRKLLLSLITAQNIYSDIKLDCRSCSYIWSGCNSTIISVLDDRYQKNRELMAYLFRKYKIKPKRLFRDNKALLENIIEYNEQTLNLLFSFGLNAKVIANKSSLLIWALKNNKPFVIKAVLSKKHYRFSLAEKKMIMDKKFIKKNRALMLTLINTPAFKNSINMRNKNGETLLMILVNRYSYFDDLVKALLKNGAKVNLKDKWGRTLLMKAYNSSTQKLLIQYGAKVNLKDKRGRTALMQNSYDNASRILLKNNAKVNARDNEGKTALMYSSTSENSQVLIKYGANVHLKDKRGRTALMYAVLKKKRWIVRVLLANKADVNVQDKEGKTALMLATSVEDEDKTDILALLFDAGAKINLQDKEGKTALMYSKSENITKFLVEKGLNIRVSKKWEAAKVIGSTPSEPSELLSQKDFNKTKYKKNATKKFVNLKDKNGHSALSYAVQNVQSNVFTLLLSLGADIYTKDKRGNNLLHILFTTKKTYWNDILKMFIPLCEKLNVDEKNKKGDTPLMSLLKNKVEKKDALAYLFIKIGKPNINLRDRNKRRIIFLLLEENTNIKHHKSKIMTLLLEKAEKFNLNLNVINKKRQSLLMLMLSKEYRISDIKNAILKTKNINLKDRRGKTALDYAHKNVDYYEDDLQDIIELLKEHGAKKGWEL